MDEPHPIPRAGHWYVTPVLARTTEALERLAHTGAFIGVVKGPPGAGKSLLLERLAGVLAQDEQLAIAHLMAGAGKGGLLVGLAVAFGVPTDGNPTQTRRALIQHLTGLHGSGRCPVVLIDAAEHLSSLELSLLIRLGLSADKGKSGLMNVILAGSGDLDQRIAVAGEHLSRQRVYVAALPALTLEESLEFLARHTDTLPPRLQGAAGRRAISRTGGVPGALIALLDDRPRGGRSLPVALVLATVIVTAIGAVLYRQLPDGFTGPAA
ncbi:MAG TPA: ATP-binding protein, partial [Plasticicumulans sp.]